MLISNLNIDESNHKSNIFITVIFLKLQSFSYFKKRQGNNYFKEITKGIGALITNSQIKYIIR